jgi:gliding motility-associated-like protein
MKKGILLLHLLFSIVCLSQAITVDQSTYTVPQLVTDVLVNSPCVNVQNITWSTGTNFGSTNGLGYFANTNPAFPMQNGVLLTTGNALNAIGPNLTDLSDGSLTWPGDTNLQTTLTTAGNTVNLKNASFIKFDFTTFSNRFNFKFLFASEEYGTFQCSAPDGFAFLLTDNVTGITTNIAVIPSTNIPISVETIRDTQYNTGCPSANVSFFGQLNAGVPANTSATNFNGQTIVMNASATLVPNRSYSIKLVIADREDNQYDSAVFLGGSSFDFGEDVLGPDLTVANNTALCVNNNINQAYTINSGLDPNLFDFVWKDALGNPLGTNPNLVINAPGTYLLTYFIQSTGCEVATNDIVIEYFSANSIPNPKDLSKCNNGSASYTFNLASNNTIIGGTGINVTYHGSLGDANNNTFALPTNYNEQTINLPKTIFARIYNTTTGCFAVKSFTLNVVTPPIAPAAWSYRLCETNNGSNTANFNLLTQNNTALNGSSSNFFNVSYYNNPTDASNGNNAINPLVAFTSGNTALTVRVQNASDLGCTIFSTLNLIVTPTPVVPKLDDQYVCTSFKLPPLALPARYFTATMGGGTQLNAGDLITTDQTIYIYAATPGPPVCFDEDSFKVEIVTPNDLIPPVTSACDKYFLQAPIPGTRFFTQGPGGSTITGNIELNPTIPIITNGQVVWAYFVSTETPPCTLDSSFVVTITPTPAVAETFTNLFDCVAINTLPTLALGKYYTYDLPTDTYTLLSLPVTATTNVFVFAETNGCRSAIKTFTIFIDNIGIADKKVCTDYTLKPAPVGEYRTAPNGGGTVIPAGNINISGGNPFRVYFYVPNNSCTNNDFFDIIFEQPSLAEPVDVAPTCEKFTLPVNPDGARYFEQAGGPSVIGNIELFANTTEIKTTKTIYLYKESTTLAGCYNEKDWKININQKPIIDATIAQIVCFEYKLTPLTNGNYYDDPMGQNPITDLTIDRSDLNANDDIPNNTKIIYVYAVNPSDPTCFTQSPPLRITIDGVKAVKKESQTVCSSYTLPSLDPNNIYYTKTGGPTGTGSIIAPLTTINTTQTIFIYKEEVNRFLTCKDESSFTITIVPKPIANITTPIVTCDNFEEVDGVVEFDLTSQAIKDEVLLTQTPQIDFTLTFYNSSVEANNSTATPIANPNKFKNDNPNSDSVWIRVTNNNLATCFDVVELKLTIKATPNPKLNKEYFICNDFEKGTLINPIILDPKISGTNFTFEWTKNNNPTIISIDPSYTATEIGTYSIKVTDTNSRCDKTITTEVKSYAPYIEIEYSNAFEEPNFVTINVQGAGTGNYEYQLGDSNFQDSNTFYNITPGEYVINVRDKDGKCAPAPINAVLINYPKFFTPNGDGYHETWNILNLKTSNPNAPINIFDRFGKLIKQITPSTDGWNGLFNGQPLPATDYWFTVDYLEKGSQKVFKSHFSLKR